jgi:beta-lactamase family protein
VNMAGLSKSRLERMYQVLSAYVERDEIPRLVALISRHDDVYVEMLGTMAVDRPAPMKRDTIFRIASITKPITAVAAIILVEECKLRLDESIETWLPELANRRVLKSISSQPNNTVPARRAITIRDLLTYRQHRVAYAFRRWHVLRGKPLPYRIQRPHCRVKRSGTVPFGLCPQFRGRSGCSQGETSMRL